MNTTAKKYLINKKEIIFWEGNEQTNPFAIFFLSIFVTAGFLAPLYVIFFEVERIKAGFIFSIVIFWWVAYYLLKLILWNLYGKEILGTQNDKLFRIIDYKNFQTKDLLPQISIRVKINGNYKDIDNVEKEKLIKHKKYPVYIEYKLRHNIFDNKPLTINYDELINLKEFAKNLPADVDKTIK